MRSMKEKTLLQRKTKRTNSLLRPLSLVGRANREAGEENMYRPRWANKHLKPWSPYIQPKETATQPEVAQEPQAWDGMTPEEYEYEAARADVDSRDEGASQR